MRDEHILDAPPTLSISWSVQASNAPFPQRALLSPSSSSSSARPILYLSFVIVLLCVPCIFIFKEFSKLSRFMYEKTQTKTGKRERRIFYVSLKMLPKFRTRVQIYLYVLRENFQLENLIATECGYRCTDITIYGKKLRKFRTKWTVCTISNTNSFFSSQV